MYKRKSVIVTAIAAVLIAVLLCVTGCFGSGAEPDPLPTEPAVYTIQYTDDAGTHTIEVEDGKPFALETIPSRTGYDFMGLYDAEMGGTQYVTASGTSLSSFTDKRNMVLFPQYKAKEYTLVLDYGGAAVTGSRQFTVSYGSSLPELPKNLTLEHSEFSGWYTEPDNGGVQVADEYGLIPIVSVINEDNFDLDSEYITLYAGFETEMFTVTFNYNGAFDEDTVEVEYDTPISSIVPDTRNADNFAVLTWSLTLDGSRPFTGRITEDTVLYAAEWAPVIELDPNGGEDITPVVARAGTTITLPTPERTNYRFMGWQTVTGETAEISEMPSSSISLTAMWQAMLVFDENGGTLVDDISQPVGTAISLPVPERNGYIFAGWYTSDKTAYGASSMPAASVELKAGWYTAKEITLDYASGDETKFVDTEGSFFTVDLTELDNATDFSGSNTVTVSGQFMADQRSTENILTDGWHDLTVGLYRATDFGMIYELTNTWYFPHGNIPNYQERTFNATVQIEDGRFYIGMMATNNIDSVRIQEFYVTITYPDTTNLYL